jgi:CubicO group peptidase (beta-lactamase class C family)
MIGRCLNFRTLSSRLAGLKGADPHGVVVVRHGTLVYEAYFPGDDQRWPEHHWNEPLPEMAHLRTAEKLRITVRDLLTMSAGLSWPYKPYLSMARQMDTAPDPYRFVLEQPMVAVPGEDWHYNNGAAELVGAVLQRATDLPLDQFEKRVLFDPLAIEDWEWGKMANGNAGASWGLRLRPRDLAKIGQLVLNRGAWRGRQVVSSDWIKEMIAPHVVRPHTRYGYLWWLDRRVVDGRDFEVVSAIGWGGQYLDVVPSLDLAVAVTAGVYDFNGEGHQEIAGDAALEAILRATEH